MKKLFLIVFLISLQNAFSQLKDIKIIIPKEIGYTYYDFVQFFPDEKHFALCANSLSIYDTETAEIIDEYELSYGAKNLSISKNGKYILTTVNNELFIFTFSNRKLELYFKINTKDLINGLPNSEYYGSLPIGGCFFTSKENEIYASIGSFTLLFDLEKKITLKSHAFPIADYIIHSGSFDKKQEVILAKTSGTVSSLYSQSLNDLSQVNEILSNTGTLTKLRIRDSLAFCYASDKYFVLNLDNKKVVHEIRMPKYDYSNLYDKKTYALINKRTSITEPDTINFSHDEYIYDMDLYPGTGTAAYATSKGIKFIDIKTKKIKKQSNILVTNLKFSTAGKRMIVNSYTPYKALRVYEPGKMNLISEKQALGNSITSADISPNKRWLFTNSGNSGFLWDLRNFSKYLELKDISGKDSSFIYNVFFLNDSELVVNSGTSFNKLNLSIYNIYKKKYIKTIKKGVFSVSSGFLNNEFYYADYTSLHILNLKNNTEEKYTGLYSLAASNMYQVINFTKDLVFVPEASKFKIINRQTKQPVYESNSWSVNARVIFSPDSRFVYTTSQIQKKKNISGVEVDMQTNAVVKIDLEKKTIVNDYAQTFFPYDFKIKDNGKVIGIWYVKYDISNYKANENETVYTEYETESGKEITSKTLAVSPEIISYHYTSDNGKYFALVNPTGNYFKVYDNKGELLIDLSDLKVTMPKCFFNEEMGRLIITSVVNSYAVFVDLNQKKIIGNLVNAKSDNFFIITSDLHYMGSKEFVKSMRFKYNSEIFGFDQFDAYLNLPHKVLREFGCSDSNLIKAYETAYLKRMKRLGLKPESRISFSTLPSLRDVKMQESKPNWVNFSVFANKGQNKLTQMEVYNNGNLVLSEKLSAAESNGFEKTYSFETSSGINQFEFLVKDEKGLESPRIVRLYNNTSIVKPDLYLLVIGSEKFKNNKFDLSYAVKDAGDIANTMANSKSFNKIFIKKMFNQSFTQDSVNKLNSFFSKAGINDVVMIFFAGHGYLDEDLSYYFPTYYTDFDDPKINSVAFGSFEKLFKDMKPTRKLMFIDACFSGEVDEDIYEDNSKENKADSTRSLRMGSSTFAQSTALEMSKAVFSDLRQNSGATIISSAGGTEAAYEGEKWNNGLFTHCLIEGLTNNKADQNADKKITLSELQKFVADEVNRLSEGKQTPTYRMENAILDYELY